MQVFIKDEEFFTLVGREEEDCLMRGLWWYYDDFRGYNYVDLLIELAPKYKNNPVFPFSML